MVEAVRHWRHHMTTISEPEISAVRQAIVDDRPKYEAVTSL